MSSSAGQWCVVKIIGLRSCLFLVFIVLGRSREVFSHDRSYYGCGVFRVSMEFVYVFSHVSFDHMVLCIIYIFV